MSSESLPSENLQPVVTKITWHVNLKTSQETYDGIVEQAKREERSVSYIVSHIVEKYHEEKSKLKVV